MNLPQILQVLSGIILMIVPIIMITRVMASKINPNATSFLIRSVVAVANLITYFNMTHQSSWKSIVMLASAVSLTLIFVTCAYKNGFKNLNKIDKISATLSLVILLFWGFSGKDIATNLLLQVVIAVSYIPTINGIKKRINKEIVLPWALASTSYALALTSLIIMNSSFVSMVNPILCLALNTVTTIIIRIVNKKTQSQ